MNEPRFLEPEKLRVGTILQVRDNNRYSVGGMIRYMLHAGLRRAGINYWPWANHTAIYLGDVNGTPCIGDAHPGGCRCTPVWQYNAWLVDGRVSVRLLWPIGATKEQGERAGGFWTEVVSGQPYDYLAYGRLILKAACQGWSPKVAGLTWAWYCSEGVANAWSARSGGETEIVYAGSPTPLTIEKRANWLPHPGNYVTLEDA